MTLDLNGLKNNLAELCSAVKVGELVPSVNGRALYGANRGWGTVHRYFYILCTFSGKEAPVQLLLRDALHHTAKQYETACKTAKAWLEDKKANRETKEEDLEAVVFLASFHKSCRKNNLVKGLQAIFQNQGGIQFDLSSLPEIDFYRRLDTFERITGTPFPFEMVKKAIAEEASSERKGFFEEYEKKMLASSTALTEEEKALRKARLIDKFVKILKDLGRILNVESIEVFALWGRMGCRELLSFVSEKRKRELESLDKFQFGKCFYPRDKSIPYDFNRYWTAIPLHGYEGKEVIVFHSILVGALLSRDRKEKEIIPINPSKKYNPDMGLLLKKGHFQSWVNLPLKEYEGELIELIEELAALSHLPVDPPYNRMEIESYGFDSDDTVAVKLNYSEIPFHIYFLHDFLFKACKKNPKDYIQLAKASKLLQNPMARHIGDAAMGHLIADERKIKFAASRGGATEHDYQAYWVEPFHSIGQFLKTKQDEDTVAVTENYFKRAFGCYPFEGVLEYLFETSTAD